MEVAYFSFWTESKPCSVCWADILEIESLGFVIWTWVIWYLRMKVAHLRILLNVESIVHISSDAQAHCINSDHPISLWSFEYMQLDYILLRRGDNSELTKSHLEHHVFSKENLLSHHDKCTSSRSNISQVELRRLMIDHWTLLVISNLLVCIQHRVNIFYLTVSSADEAFRYHNVIACWMSSQSSSILAYDINIIEKLAFYSFEDQYIHV